MTDTTPTLDQAAAPVPVTTPELVEMLYCVAPVLCGGHTATLGLSFAEKLIDKSDQISMDTTMYAYKTLRCYFQKAEEQLNGPGQGRMARRSRGPKRR